MEIDHISLFGGIPFIDGSFHGNRLLAALMVVRAREAERAGMPMDESELLFDPLIASKVRQATIVQDIPFEELGPVDAAQVDGVLKLLGELVPSWLPLCAIPVKFCRLSNSAAISASSFAWPQHVFLGPAAFETVAQLAEQIVHELCHCWLYFLEEVAPVQRDTVQDLVLPSGTSQRDVAEVLGALHVSAALLTLWSVLPVDEQVRTARLAQLVQYGAGCVEVLRDHEERMTPGGRNLMRSLAYAVRAAGAAA